VDPFKRLPQAVLLLLNGFNADIILDPGEEVLFLLKLLSFFSMFFNSVG